MSLISRRAIKNKLIKSKEFRDAYVNSHLKLHIPLQIRAMREERGWTQTEAGKALGKSQNAISRLESRDYGSQTLKTLLEIASGFDVGLLVKFVPFSRLVREYEDLSPSGMSAKGILDPDNVQALESWVLEGTVEIPSHDSVTEGSISVSGQDIVVGSLTTTSGSLTPHQHNLFMDLARPISTRRTQKRKHIKRDGIKPLPDDEATNAPMLDGLAA